MVRGRGSVGHHFESRLGNTAEGEVTGATDDLLESVAAPGSSPQR